jgi:capsular polysaccharide biosynthesis protein
MNEKNSIGLGYYLFVLRRQWMTILGMAVIGLVAMGGYVALVPGKILASTVVNVNVIVADPFNPSRPASGLLDAATESKLASSYVGAANAARALDNTETAVQLRDGVSVTTGLNATIVTISYASTTADRARSGADALAKSYIDYRQSQAEATKKKMIGNLEDQLGTLNKSLATTQAADKSALNTRISNVEFQINQLTAIDTTGGSVISPAAQNPVTTQPQPSLLLVSGLLVGMVLGIILAFILNSLARRVRDGHDVDIAGAGPVVMALDSPNGSLPPQGKELAAYRSLRERLLAATGNDIGVLTVIDETIAWAASDVGQGLAVVLAQSGHDVDLVLMGTSASKQMQLRGQLKLAPSVVDAEEDSAVMVSALIPRLRVIYPLGTDGAADTDDFVTDDVRRRVDERLPGVTTILVLPPKAAASSRLAAARLAQSALLVAQHRRTRIAVLSERAQELADVDTPLHGVVLVRATRESGAGARATSAAHSKADPQPVSR